MFTPYSNVSIVEFEQINVSLVWEMVVSGNKFVSSNCEKYIVLWTEEICWTNMCFRLWSLKGCEMIIFHDSTSKR